MDIADTVGWFTTLAPLRLDLGRLSAEGEAGLGEALKLVKEALRAMPRGGQGYGLLRYAGGNAGFAQGLDTQDPPEVLFNHLGDTD